MVFLFFFSFFFDIFTQGERDPSPAKPVTGPTKDSVVSIVTLTMSVTNLQNTIA
jgi:hypothetical protein